MTVRAVEWKLPYTWWKAITVDENKVISLNLRDENNLIIYDQGDNEIYVDLQLPAWIRPNYAFPVWITTGRVLVADDWDVTWTIIVAKTTSWDVIKLLYGDDWTLWMDNGTGLFKQIYFKADVDLIITNLTTYINTELAKKQDKLTAGTGISISQNNEISNTLPWAVVSATAPSNPSQWDMWYDTTTDTLKTYDGTQWNWAGWGWSGDVQVSTDTGNLLSTGVKLWLGDKADFESLGSLDANTIYAPAIMSRKPWANTLVYYEFNNNLSDSSGNNVNLTNQWTISYVSNPNAVVLWNSNYLYATSFSDDWEHDWTLNVWVNITTRSWWPSFIASAWTNSSYAMVIPCISSSGYTQFSIYWEDNIWTIPTNTNTWYNIVYTYNYSTRNYKTYVNWVKDLDGTLNQQYNIPSSYLYIWAMANELAQTNFRLKWKLSKYILEDKEWDATKISYYFDLTKWDYWVS